MSRNIVFLRGSPSSTSRSAVVAEAVATEVQRAGLRPIVWSLTDFDPADVFFGRAAAPAVARFIEDVRGAVALVLATPVYKAAYTGALKAIVDLIPPDALVDRPALGIATARLAAHGAEVDRAYRALFAFFKARALDTLLAFDHEVLISEGAGCLLEAAADRALQAARTLITAVNETAPAVMHP